MLKVKDIQGNIIRAAISIAIILTAVSCITPRKVNYLQDMTQGSQIELENKFEAKIAPYDELAISVISWDNPTLAAPFNINLAQGTNIGTNGQRGFLVDVNGNIQYPVLGNLHVAGMTRLQLQDTLTNRLIRGGYITDPFVMVRFNNFKIFYLCNGTGGVLNVPNEKCTFLEALAMMGDLDRFTRRDRIAVMREINGKMVMRYLDPRSSKVFNDPFFMMQQNDFIITSATNGGTLRSEFSYWWGMIGTLTSVASLITSIALFITVKKDN